MKPRTSNETSTSAVTRRSRRPSRRSISSLSERDESAEVKANHVNGRREESQENVGQEGESNPGDDDGVLEGQNKKRRRKKRFVYAVFYAKPAVKINTKISLKAQKKFVKSKLAGKLTALKKESVCFAAKVARLEGLEQELSQRYAAVKGLNVKHDGDQLEEQNELLESMEKTIEKVQKLLDKWQLHQKTERLNLLETVMADENYPHPICCQFCFDAKSKRGRQSAV